MTTVTIDRRHGPLAIFRRYGLSLLAVIAAAVVVSVCDSDTGLDAHQAERLFEAFYTTKPNGMGIGLAICRSIMQTHGGRLMVRANEPSGTIFEVELPIERVEGDSPSPTH